MLFASSPTLDAYLAPEDVHDLQRQPDASTLVPTFFVALILGFLHGLNVYYLFWMRGIDATSFDYDRGALFVFLAVHAILVLIALLYARARERGERVDYRYDMLLVITTLCMGFAGALGTAVSILFFGFFQRFALHFSQWFSSIFPLPEATLPERVNEGIITGRDESATDYSVISFTDVMAIGSEAQKREALSKMTAMFHPSFAPAYRRALNDDNNAIRVQAATSIAKIESHFLERSIQIEALRREHPADQQLLLLQARHFDDYAYTGILDSEREETNRARALEAYHQYLSRNPSDLGARLSVGRLLLRSGHTEQAADWLRQSIDAGYSNGQIISWYLESLYKLGRYSDLRAASQRFGATVEQAQPALLESLRLWAGRTQGEAA